MSGSVWFFDSDAMLPNSVGKLHMHYPPLEQVPSEHDLSLHGGNDIYNIVVTKHDIHFIGKDTMNKSMNSRYEKSGFLLASIFQYQRVRSANHKLMRIVFLLLIVIICSCSSEKSERTIDFEGYFGHLMTQGKDDRGVKRELADAISRLNEPFFIDSIDVAPTYRLTVVPPFANPYCIKVIKDSSNYKVTYKVSSGRRDDDKVDGLTMTYQNSGPHVDSLFRQFFIATNDAGIRSGNNLYDISGATDGTYYLFEAIENRKHIVVFRVYAGPISFSKVYTKADEFLSLVSSIEAFVPDCLTREGGVKREIK